MSRPSGEIAASVTLPDDVMRVIESGSAWARSPPRTRRRPKPTPSANAAPEAAATSTAALRRETAGPGAAAGASSTAASAMRASPMSRSLCFGSRSRQRRSSARMRGGVSGGKADQSIVSRTTAASTSVTVSPAKSLRPESSS